MMQTSITKDKDCEQDFGGKHKAHVSFPVSKTCWSDLFLEHKREKAAEFFISYVIINL